MKEIKIEESLKQVLRGFSRAPETQCDPEIAKRIAGWAELDTLTTDEVKKTLDEIVFGSLASGFVVNVLDIILVELSKDEANL